MEENKVFAAQTAPVAAEPPKAIVKALLKVLSGVKPVEKSGTNVFHKYDYATQSDVIKMLRPLMVDAELVVTQHAVAINQDPGQNMMVGFQFILSTPEASWIYPGVWVGVAQDRNRDGVLSDKWFSKAATSAEKYFLIKLFHIETVEETDADDTKAPAKPAQPSPIDEARALFTQIEKAVGDAVQQSQLTAIWEAAQANLAKIRGVSAEGADRLEKKYQAKLASFAHPAVAQVAPSRSKTKVAKPSISTVEIADFVKKWDLLVNAAKSVDDIGDISAKLAPTLDAIRDADAVVYGELIAKADKRVSKFMESA